MFLSVISGKVVYLQKKKDMAAIIIERNQRYLLDEMTHLIPQYDSTEVIGVLKTAISQIKKCRKIKDVKPTVDYHLSPRIQSLIGVVPPISQKDVESDERLKHILGY